MIAGIGIDSTEIDRFREWAYLNRQKLEKIFSSNEIEYCLSNLEKSAERFAARFAAKEALFKTLSQIIPENKIPFLTICKNAKVENENNGNPKLLVHWKNFDLTDSFRVFITLNHTSKTATAFVVVENID